MIYVLLVFFKVLHHILWAIRTVLTVRHQALWVAIIVFVEALISIGIVVYVVFNFTVLLALVYAASCALGQVIGIQISKRMKVEQK